jgi:uncharacterized membrane protein YeaQ/YmgE (transglycosylase-associated protein family)
MNLLDCLGWLAIGVFVGWIPSLVMRVQRTLNVLLDIAVAVGGAFIGGMLVGGLEYMAGTISGPISLGGMLAAIGGALIALALSGRGRWHNNHVAPRHRRYSSYLYN